MASGSGSATTSKGNGAGIGFPGLPGILLAATAVLMVADLYLIFLVAPTDAVLGHVQRIFYFHVPIAIVSFVAFFVVFVASIGYLVTRKSGWDSVAHAAAEVGVVFVSLALLTGIVWARPVWNVWWTWEPRLTTTLILWLIYVAYLMLRSYVPNKSQGALYAAGAGHHRLHRRAHRVLLGAVVAVHPPLGSGRPPGQFRRAGAGNAVCPVLLHGRLPVAVPVPAAGADAPAQRRRPHLHAPLHPAPEAVKHGLTRCPGKHRPLPAGESPSFPRRREPRPSCS